MGVIGWRPALAIRKHIKHSKSVRNYFIIQVHFIKLHSLFYINLVICIKMSDAEQRTPVVTPEEHANEFLARNVSQTHVCADILKFGRNYFANVGINAFVFTVT